MSYTPIQFPKKVPVNFLGMQSSGNIFTDLVASKQDVNFIALVGFRRTGKSLFAKALANDNTSVYVYEDLDIRDGRKHIEPIIESYKRQYLYENYWGWLHSSKVVFQNLSKKDLMITLMNFHLQCLIKFMI